MHHAALPAPGGEAELYEWLGEFWSHRLDRHRPLWEMTLLDGLEGGRWALASKTHHCLVDGVGSLDIGHLLLDASRTLRRRPRSRWPRVTGGTANTLMAGFGSRLASSCAALGRASALRHTRASPSTARAAVELVVRDEVIAAPQTSLNGP